VSVVPEKIPPTRAQLLAAEYEQDIQFIAQELSDLFACARLIADPKSAIQDPSRMKARAIIKDIRSSYRNDPLRDYITERARERAENDTSDLESEP